MKALFTFLSYTVLVLNALGQERVNKPVPKILEQNKGELSEQITGWTYSLDGQWVGEENTISTRQMTLKKTESQSHTQLGIDNVKNLVVHEVAYAEDTLLLLVKLFEDGYYKYPRSKKGWTKRTSLHYFVIHQPDLPLDSIQDSIVHQFKFRLIDSGTILNVSKRKYLVPIEERMNLMNCSNRYLHLDIQLWRSQNIFRFNLYANHEVFNDLEGTVCDLKIKGKSLFGTEQLMNYIYFETDLNSFANLNLLKCQKPLMEN